MALYPSKLYQKYSPISLSSPLILTRSQRDTLREYCIRFNEWLESDKGKQTIIVHRDHEKYFKEKLSLENLSNMTEDDLADIYKKLWASNVWGNKNWYITNKLIHPNGIDKIKDELKKLLYGSDNIVPRYNNFRKNITGFGASSISEILHFMFPDKYCLWNEKPKSVLQFLQLNILPQNFFKYQIDSGEKYYQCVEALSVIKKELAEFDIKDFIDLDILFWHIFDDIIPKQPKLLDKKEEEDEDIQPPKLVIDSHESAEYHILELGKMMGYLTYTVDQSKTFNKKSLGDVALLEQIPAFAGERDLVSARMIDVIWFGDDENPKLCFEVEHSTDIVHGLNRLAQLQHLYVNFFIIASEDRRNKFENEMKKYPFRGMKDRFGFISYDELVQLYSAALPFYALKGKLLKEN
jgi:hypothetical protein